VHVFGNELHAMGFDLHVIGFVIDLLIYAKSIDFSNNFWHECVFFEPDIFLQNNQEI